VSKVVEDDASEIPEDVRELIRERVCSVEELEILMLLESEPARAWQDAEVATALGASREVVRTALAKLAAAGLVHAEDPGRGPTRLQPESEALRDAVALLGNLYRTQRIDILVFIAQSAISRVRNQALHTFAQAFRIKKGKPDG
jgi:DNA-binding GntR family transcriptional regulator